MLVSKKQRTASLIFRPAIRAVRAGAGLRSSLLLLKDFINCCERIRIGVQVACLSACDSRFRPAVLALEGEGVGETGHVVCEAVRVAVSGAIYLDS
jgi:hypothetical protein